MTHASICLDHVTLTLGTADFAFDAQIAPQKITAVTGASGSGKSTFLNLIAGFEVPARGRVLLNGKDATQLSPGERPVSLVFQDHNLFAHLDLATNIGLGIDPALRLRTEDKAAITHALQRVGLGGFEHRKPSSLSGGEKQRAAFARALVRDKPILLLDEPFAALDPGLRASMAELLLTLHRETGNTVLIVTHDPRDVERLADDVIFIDHGTIHLHGTRADFLHAEKTEALQSFLGLAKNQ
ncbi:ATP-binding cassette domain-containing protein [Rhizobium oryziradicis]|uniref:Thiamine ABC transporter ATP-binding protein n=1 Tax=Rhizobium oryziradicis TaxID=1867956 RepID=A0A1Q8ZLE4_9HYPH|nr:ATP-binding cassette domain-containing protein [Rhizobium oryziradicis]OLP42716.1 thiamine ABC transporter ATP-binding protein [Rhizobium oryziradicis]